MPPASSREIRLASRPRLEAALRATWFHGRVATTAGGYLAAGRLKALETVVNGVERAAQASVDMTRGGGIGKTLVGLV
jgi:NADPH-dependent curcumin reductase CurA